MDDSSILKSPHKNFEDVKKIDENWIEYWEARELMPLLEYTDWRNFKGVLLKAQEACKNSKQVVGNHFVETSKKIKIAKAEQLLPIWLSEEKLESPSRTLAEQCRKICRSNRI